MLALLEGINKREGKGKAGWKCNLCDMHRAHTSTEIWDIYTVLVRQEHDCEAQMGWTLGLVQVVGTLSTQF